MIAQLFAIVAMLLWPVPLRPTFVADVLSCDHAIVQPGEFIGCEGATEAYAGLVWVNGEPIPEVGP